MTDIAQDLPPRCRLGGPIPETPGRAADLLHEVTALRQAMQKDADYVKARETELRDHLIATLDASDDTGASGLRYHAKILRKTKPTAVSWNEIYDYVAENDRFDLLQRRLSDKAVMEIIDNGETIPGVGKIIVKSVSITKI